MTVRGVIVAAGYGTRFLPITRTVPKEMLPLWDRPCVDFIVEEFIEAGIEEILVITSRRKKALDDWFDRDLELEGALKASGKLDRLAKAHPPRVRVQFIRQQTMEGTGGALLLAQSFAQGDPVVVAFPDDLFRGDNVTAALIEAHRHTGCSTLAALDYAGRDVSAYGVLDAKEGQAVAGIVEKPAPGTEPSSLISVGRYLYTNEFFTALQRHRVHHTGGEYTPMPALNELASLDRLQLCIANAQRWDTGTPLGYFEAFLDLALEHPLHGQQVRQMVEKKLRT